MVDCCRKRSTVTGTTFPAQDRQATSRGRGLGVGTETGRGRGPEDTRREVCGT
jgi:hypothetical protein